MSRPLGGAPFVRLRTVAIAMLLLTCTSVLPAEADPEARFGGTGKADPMRIANVKCKPSGVEGASSVAFDLAWDHSWRAAWGVPAQQHGGTGALKLESWDAAWMFVKFRKPGADGWSSATLSTNAADHSPPAGATLDVGPSDDGKRGVGAFVYRGTAGSGPNDWKGVTVRWLHKADGIEDPGAVDLKVFAIQMVYVPQCAFWLGDGSTTVVAGQFSAGDSADPYRVESEDAIALGGQSRKNLLNRDGIGMYLWPDDFTSGCTKALPARFPKGYAAFYCMRHEITEGEYLGFLNTVGSKRQAGLAPIESRDGQPLTGIKIGVPGKPGTPAVYESDRPHVPCRCLLSSDYAAYAAWAGLRPMTELEYEKACRGPLRPVPDEYAWGTAGIAGTSYHRWPTGRAYQQAAKSAAPCGYALQNTRTPEESVVWQGDHGPDASHGNAVWDGSILRKDKSPRPFRPGAVSTPLLRAGVFATPDSDRVAAGASYWGILELSGSLWERVVTVGSWAGRRFAGTHGDWSERVVEPGERGWGFGVRGGAINSWTGSNEHNRLRTSDREMLVAAAGMDQNRAMSMNVAFRCVRTAKIVPLVAALPDPEPMPARPVLSRSGAPVLRSTGWDSWKVSIQDLAASPRDAKTRTLTFDISWDKSWRDEHNHDAAWVFFKVQADDTPDWQHVRLVADRVLNPTGYGQAEGGAPLDLIVPDGDDGFTGMLVRRATRGEGPLAARRVTAVWDFTPSKGITKDTKVSLRAFGIAMVYVPEGAFYLGSGGLEVGGFYQYTDGSQQTKPYRVTGPGAIPTGRKPGMLWVRNHGGPLENGGQIPASLPNGYAAFYCMKYHIIANQYAEFLNALNEEQANERDPSTRSHGLLSKSPERGYCGKPGGARQGPGCLGLSWADGATFAAWAGLRPMTELECEKVVRGTREPIPDEVGPSYWGVSGYNTWVWNAMKGDQQCERPVTVSNAAGRRFTGTHGRGTLTLPADWPQADAVGSGLRCIWYSSRGFDVARARVSAPGFSSIFTNSKCEDMPRARLSDRLLAAIADPERLDKHKWRGARTAPKGVGP